MLSNFDLFQFLAFICLSTILGLGITANITSARDDCFLNISSPLVSDVSIEDGVSWAYAGVNANPAYLCNEYFDFLGTRYTFLRWQAQLANTMTSDFRNTTNGCDFSRGNCTDPILRQQIIDSNICRSNSEPQQIVDRLVLTVNRQNWLYVMPIQSFSALTDDNFCLFGMANNNLVVAAKVDVN